MVQAVFRVRPEQPEDLPVIRQVHLAAFPTTAEADLVDQLRQNGNLSLSLVVVIGDQVVGHAAASPVTLNSVMSNPADLGIGPIALLPDWQKQGGGSILLEAVIEAARDLGTRAAVVLGEPSFYQRWGFETASRRGLQNAYGVDTEFMVLELQPGSLEGRAGLIKYSPEFDVFD